MIYSTLSQNIGVFDTNINVMFKKNLSEAFNGRYVKARCKATGSMPEDITIMVINKMHSQRDTCTRWTRNYGPIIVHKLH